MNTILDNKYTQGFILVCILVNVVVLSVETPTAVLEDSTRDMLHLADLLLSIIFSSKPPADSRRFSPTPLDVCWQLTCRCA